MLRSVDALIFDLDGTLVDSSGDIAASLNFTLRRLGLPVKSEREVQKFVGDGVGTLLSRATGRSEPGFISEAAELFKAHYTDHCVDTTRLYPGVMDVLDFYHSKKKAVVSNKPNAMLLSTLEHFSIKSRFEAVLGAESTERRKPHPDPLLKSLEVLGVRAERSVMVGDGTTDIQAGKAAGVLTCAVTYGYRPRRDLEELKPDFFIDRMEDLKRIVV